MTTTRRPTMDDYVRVRAGHHSSIFDAGDTIRIIVDDHTHIPYFCERERDGAQGWIHGYKVEPAGITEPGCTHIITEPGCTHIITEPGPAIDYAAKFKEYVSEEFDPIEKDDAESRIVTALLDEIAEKVFGLRIGGGFTFTQI